MLEQRPWRWVPTLMQQRPQRLIIWAGAGCFVILILLAVVGDRGFLDVYEFSRHLERVEHQINAVETERAKLQEEVVGLRHDLHQVEKLAREELGLVRPDEIVFAIVGTQDAP